MQELKQPTQSYETSKTLSAICFTSRIDEEEMKKIFCSGSCKEADSLNDVCIACVNEYNDWERSR